MARHPLNLWTSRYKSLGDKQERQRIRNVLKFWKPNDTETIELIKDCQHIRTEFMDNYVLFIHLYQY